MLTQKKQDVAEYKKFVSEVIENEHQVQIQIEENKDNC
jgi:hypothetical protein